MHFPVVAIDIGFGQVKMAVRLPEDPKTFSSSAIRLPADPEVYIDMFPSLTPRYVSSGITGHTSHETVDRTYVVSVNNTEFAVGPDVKHSLGGTTGNGRILTDNFPTTVNYRALFLGALEHLGVTEIDHVVLGLPVHTARTYKDELMATFKGQFQLKDRLVNVHNAIVLPQPIGAMIHYSAVSKNGIHNGKKRLVIDCGYRTTDWVVADGYRTIESRSDGTAIGASKLLLSVASLIKKDNGRTFDDIEALDECLIKKQPLRHFNKVYSYDELKAFLTSSRFIADNCAQEILTSVGAGGDLESIIVVGGSAEYFTESIRNLYPDAEIEHMKNSSFCNVLGFLCVGENVAHTKKTA